MCDANDRRIFVRELRKYLADRGIPCEKIEETDPPKARHGFWIEDSRWKGADGKAAGFATACSDERPAALREPHRLTPTFHLPPGYPLRPDVSNEALLHMPSWHDKPGPNYTHLWFTTGKGGPELDIANEKFTPEFGDRVYQLLKAIQVTR